MAKSEWNEQAIRDKIRSGHLPALQGDLFTQKKTPSIHVGLAKQSEIKIELTFVIPAMKDKEGNILDPIAKQSVRSTIIPRFKDIGKRIENVLHYPLNKLMVHHYQPQIIVDWEKHIKKHIYEQLPITFKMWEQEVEIKEIIFVFKALKSFRKKDKEYINAGNFIKKTTKSDIDNLSKAVYDAMEGIIYKNDSLIWKEGGRLKLYGKEPFIKIILQGK